MTQNENENNGKSGLAIGSLALGAIAGAIAGILFAPQSGRETREDLKDTLNRVKDDVAVKLSEVKEVTQDTYRNVVDSVIQAYKDTKQLTAEQAEKISIDLNKGYEDIKKAASKTAADIQDKAPANL